jgi:hypothetical protein
MRQASRNAHLTPATYPHRGAAETITICYDGERLLPGHDGMDKTLLECKAIGITISL